MDKIDKFLLDNKIVIEDDGFTRRVMETLPARVDWQRRLSRMWNCICIILLVAFCWKTEVLGNLWIDAKAFFVTLPANIIDVNVWQTMGIFYGTILVLTFIIIGKYEKVF